MYNIYAFPILYARGLFFNRKESHMGKDLKGKELGLGICQQSNGMYVARFTDRFGERRSRRFTKLQECRNWIAEAKYSDEYTDATYNSDVFVDSWFEY